MLGKLRIHLLTMTLPYCHKMLYHQLATSKQDATYCQLMTMMIFTIMTTNMGVMGMMKMKMLVVKEGKQ